MTYKQEGGEMKHIDCQFTREVVCPYCGYEHGDSWEIDQNDFEMECEECGMRFKGYREIEVTYSSEKKQGDK